MKRIIFIISIISLHLTIAAQSKDFEGVAVYKIDIKSKTAGVSDRVCRNMLAFGDSMTVIIKQGNSKQITGPADIYSITKDQKVYMKFRGIDTLYYMDYSSDTTTVLEVLKSEEKKTIAGFECKMITIKSPGAARKYYYAPSIYVNPEYDKNNKIGRYDAFVKETSSLYLGYDEDNASYNLGQTCTRLQQQPVDNSVFELPKLPRKIFTAESITVQPKFNRSGGFDKYLQLNLDPAIGAKYLKIPKHEESATQTATVLFMINENGRVSNVSIVNKDEVLPKLAEEAIRVVSASPPWTPASVLGEKVIFWYKQLITFAVSKK